MVGTVRHPRFAIALCVCSLLLLACGFLLAPITLSFLVFSVAIGLSFSVVGTLIATRRPDNPVGWLLLGFGVIASLTAASDQYFVRGAIVDPGSLPGTDFVISLAIHTWHPGFAFFILAFFLFPDGTVLSSRWRVPVWITISLGVAGVIFGMFEFEFQRNWDPETSFAMQPLVDGPLRAIGDVVFGFCVIGMVVMFAASAAGLVVRLRRSGGVVHDQIKWVVFAIVMTVMALVTSLFIFGHGALGALMLPSIPISMAVAVLRYRLFDIDRLIRRTIVYAAVTAVLAGVYGGLVVGLGVVFGAEGRAPPALVAAATLAVAALFRPVRNRLQGVVNHRFNRRGYDAERTIEAFSRHLRNELDLDALSSTLIANVHKTMEPTQVSLWLKASSNEDPGTAIGS